MVGLVVVASTVVLALLWFSFLVAVVGTTDVVLQHTV